MVAMTRRERHRVHLTAEFVRSVLDYDPQTGILRWRHRWDRPQQWNTRYSGTVAGQINNGYRCIQVERDKGAYNAARLAWLYVTGEWPLDQIDHINGIRDDNRWRNLRAASNAENNRNRGAQSNNGTGLRGVSRWGKRWQARISVDGRQVRVGAFDTPEEAAAAYAAAARRLHGEFARTE